MKWNLKLSFVLVLTFLSNIAFASKISYEKSLDLLLKNIHPADTIEGVVVASPSRSHPDYFYHWVRDAALVMNTIFDVMESEQNIKKKKKLKKLMYEFVNRVKGNQIASGFWKLGEPKYNVDGTPFTGPWGRPQHDGPALRAITLIKFANCLLKDGKADYVKENLYSPTLPALTVIKKDLEYTARHWSLKGFDYWEEVKGLHFSTMMAQRRAMIDGAKLARRLNDPHAATFYEGVAMRIEQRLKKFWNPTKDYIESTQEQTRGVQKSQLDISVVLGVHHSGLNDGFFDVLDPRVIKTVNKLNDSFNRIYKINGDKNLGTAIGRYPEDTYDGYRTDKEGNPWFLATFAMAEYYLRVAKASNYSKASLGNICLSLKLKHCSNMTQKKFKTLLTKKANTYFERADFHADQNGHMSEQMNRYNGYMMGARDLTWSYASHISALLQK